MFSTVLIANRGEIACRVIRTCEALGIRSVAVYSDADADARHVELASTAMRIGPADARASYLKIDAIIDAARRTGAEAIHPGYGFLAENADFARACAEAGIVFVGPPVSAIETMGDKIRARAAVEARGVPTVPGLAKPGLTNEDLLAAAADVGFPVLIKPSAGGGGKGMHRVDDPADLADALARARREAGASFGDDTLFIERFVTNPRHIEVQVLADAHGHTIHLGERECSLQRRHQKVIEEAPSALLTPAQRERIGQAAVDTAKAVDYVGAGTVEFIVSGDQPDQPFFMEMNTRLQVEHPVTELVTGVDLVEQQLRIAAGEPLQIQQADVTLTGHAVEARLYAEDPAAGFLPTGGRVLDYAEAEGVRTDSAIVTGTHVSSQYDPMLAKVIAHAPTREAALVALDSALAHTRVLGVTTNTSFLRKLLTHEDVRAGRLDTALIDRFVDDLTARQLPAEVPQIAALILWAQRFARADGLTSRWARPDGWRISTPRPTTYTFDVDGEPLNVTLTGTPSRASVKVADGDALDAWVRHEEGQARVGIDGLEWTVPYAIEDGDARTIWLTYQGDWHLREFTAERLAYGATGKPTLEAPMPGAVVNLAVSDGDHVEAGDPVVSVEAMKMEHVVAATLAGTVTLNVRVGQQVTRGQVLATVDPDQPAE